VDLFPDGRVAGVGKREAKKEADAAFQSHKGIAIGSLNFLCTAANRGRVWNSPMSRQRMARPQRANLLRSVVTDREDEIDLRRVRLAELLPTLAPEIVGRQMSAF
jgi:hypothetical protein